MQSRRGTKNSGFTLIELTGVLAVVGVLASILLPKVFETINNARLSAVPLGLRTVKTATLEHFVRYNSIPSRNGTSLTFSDNRYDGFDLVLLQEGFLDKPFTSRVGTNVTIRLVDVSGLDADSDPVDRDDPGAYDLNGDGSNDIINARYLLEAVFDEPSRADVAGLNNIIDGPSLGFAGSPGQDIKGKVVYRPATAPNPHANPNSNHGRPAIMCIYIAHR